MKKRSLIMIAGIMSILSIVGVFIFDFRTRLNIDFEGQLISERGGFYDSIPKKFTRAILIQNNYRLMRGAIYHEPYAARFVFYSSDVTMSVNPHVILTTPDGTRPNEKWFRVVIYKDKEEDSDIERMFRVALDFRSRIVSLDGKKIGELPSAQSILVVKLAEDLSVAEAYTSNGDLPDFLAWVNDSEEKTEQAAPRNR